MPAWIEVEFGSNPSPVLIFIELFPGVSTGSSSYSSASWPSGSPRPCIRRRSRGRFPRHGRPRSSAPAIRTEAHPFRLPRATQVGFARRG